MQLMRTAGRTVLAGFAVAFSLGVTVDAWAQQIPGCERVRGSPRWDRVPSLVQAVLDDPGATDDQLRGARADCANMGDVSVEGSLCVARANIRLADRGIEAASGYAGARCSAYRGGYLGRSNNDARERASALRAEALVGLMRVNSGSADQYSRELLQSDVHNARAAESVHRAVVRMHVDRGRLNEALAEARSDSHLRGTARALALIDIAGMQGADPRLLDDAYAADGNSVAVNAALGAAYFERGEANWQRAWDRLEYATRVGQRPEAGYEDLQLNAYYYRSLLESSGRGYGTLAQALDHAEDAGNTERALRQVCLVRLMIGGEDMIFEGAGWPWRRVPGTDVWRNAQNQIVRPNDMSPSDEGLRSCQRLGNSLEGPLLEGMFWLRYSQYRAQYFNPAFGQPGHTEWLQSVTRAERLFGDGKDRVGNDRRPLGWPGAEVIANTPQAAGGGRERITLRTMYGFADDLGDFFGSGCTIPMDSTREELWAQSLFVHYDIVGPPGVPHRCQPPENN